MKSLNRKVFVTIFVILCVCSFLNIVIFGVQFYSRERSSVLHSLEMARDNGKNRGPNDDRDFDNGVPAGAKFLDGTVYTVLLDSSNDIRGIINHTNNSVSDKDIENIAKDILSSNPRETSINLFSNYSYLYSLGDELIIYDNAKVRDDVFGYFGLSFLLLIFLLIVIYFVALVITRYITKPANDSFISQKRFIADASHELKTPLSVIISSNESLIREMGENKWSNYIKVEAERMSNLVSDLLNLSSLEEGRNDNRKLDDLSKCVLLSSLALEGKFFENGNRLITDIEESIKFLMDSDSIRNLVEILLDNALKHSDKNSDIMVSLKKSGNCIILSVKNFGEGIPRGDEERIFERFYRVSKARERKDNRYGLGLAIAKSIVINHNGVISASSNNGETIFRVLFKN